MILLTKTQKPQVLVDHAGEWTGELLAVIAANQKPSDYLKSRYNHPQIKRALIVETNAKCAYCESKLTHVTYGDIEHVIPKQVEPQLCFEWTNLTFACDVCNTNKGTKQGFVDPYAGDPQTRFVFKGAMVWGRFNDAQATLTEAELELNRDGLIERRGERLEFIRKMIVAALGLVGDARSAVFDLARSHARPQKEFSASVRESLIGHFEELGIAHGL